MIYLHFYNVQTNVTALKNPLCCNAPLQLLETSYQFTDSMNLSFQKVIYMGSSRHPQVWWFARRTYRTQHVILTAKIYYSERMQSNNQHREKAHRAKSRWNQAQVSKSSLPVELVDVLNSSSTELQHDKCCLLGKLIRDSVSRIFIRGWSYRQSV